MICPGVDATRFISSLLNQVPNKGKSELFFGVSGRTGSQQQEAV
jgi:hypothetical protein